MKQKRKVKSLIPQKKFTSKSLKTAWLVILWSALYLASITLLTTSVAFWANEAWYETFTGFNLKDFPIKDKAEVVYAARFATRDNFKLNNNNKIIDIFMNKDWVLYIIPKPVIVNPALNDTTINHQRNEVEENVYGHVLWWDENKVHSNNITIIAWYKNKVNTWNDNAVILWWEENTINQWEWAPSAIIWWTNNTIETGHKWSNVIIWWNNNKITENVSSSAILWWEKNTIESDNAIVWWSNVTISGTENVFAYSNSSNFTPKNPNSFFLNMQKGVWINMEASSSLSWLYVSGAVSLWFIDIGKPCNSNNNYWLEWQYDGCLVWCTTGWWRMLDLGEKCENVCNNAKNNLHVIIHCPTHEEDDDLVAPTDYKAFCDGPADTGHAHQCPWLTNEMKNYKNVIFETKLIDSTPNGTCPVNIEDKCIYQCDPWYHLTGNNTWFWDKVKKCYSGCTAPRGATGFKTNDKIIAYDGDAACSNDAWTNIWDHCGNHKATLICYDWKRYKYNWSQRDRIPDTRYKKESCTLSDYRCNPTIYNLKKDNILSESYYNDVVGSHTWNTGDRSTTILTRWQYELCLDYDPQEPAKNSEQCNEVDKNTPHTEHYKFIKCNTGYDEMEINWVTKCMKQCEFTPAGETKPTKKKHNQTITLYSGDSATCPDVCTSKTFTCNDGSWVNSWEMNTFKYKECSLKSQDRDPTFTIPETTYKTRENAWYTKHSEYESETISIVKKQNNECENETKYKIVWCKDPYFHLSPSWQYCIRENSSRGRCGSLIEYSHRTDNDEEPFQSVEFWELKRTAGSTWAKNVWSWTWDNREVKSRNKCGSGCDSGFSPRKTNWKTYCVKDWSCPTNPDRAWCPNGNKPNIIRPSTWPSTYWSTWTCPWEWVGAKPSSSCHFCAEGYEWDGTVCYHCEPWEYWNPDYRICEEPEESVTEEWRCHNYDTNNRTWSGYVFELLEEAFNDEHIKCYQWKAYWDFKITKNNKLIGYTRTCLDSNDNFEYSDECHECEPWYTWDDTIWISDWGRYGTCVKSNGEECVGTNCPNPNGDEDEDGECNNEWTIPSWNVDDSEFCVSWKIKLSSRNGPNNHMFTWTCDWIGWGNPSGECKKCEDLYILSGNECVTTDVNITPIWDTPECWSASWWLYADRQIDIIRNNACSERSELNGNVSTNDTKFTRECKQWGDIKTCKATRMTCGSASGVASSEIPSKNLCKESNLYWNVSSNTNNTEWQWRCWSGSTQFKCTAPRTTYECKWTPPWAYTIKSSSTPTWSDLDWSYKTGKSINQLWACEWSCKDSHYVRSGSTMDCKPATQAIPCGDAPTYSAPDHSRWIKSTIVQERDWEKRTPSKPTNTCITGSTSNIACSFKCDSDYRCNAAWTGCIKVDNRTCKNYGTYNLCNDWTEWTPDWSGNGYLYWKCGKKRCETCDSSKGYNYKDGICKKCNNCAKNGFPYCFPINFKSDCDESLYLTTE